MRNIGALTSVENTDSSTEGIAINNPYTSLYASVTYGHSMTRAEFFSHSLPYLHAISREFTNIRIIEAGGNPYKDNESSDERVSSKAAAQALNAALKS